jgi:2-polyprenyl-3-methyl-5-hydroxy-6-metoxy-1,4-benzoquinol methylase
MMEYMTKRNDELSPDQVQEGNRAWWTRNPMSYDWKKRVEYETYSREWFDAIDERFIYGSRLFATRNEPFDQIIPFERLSGSRVLEIGCGLGLHTE